MLLLHQFELQVGVWPHALASLLEARGVVRQLRVVLVSAEDVAEATALLDKFLDV